MIPYPKGLPLPLRDGYGLQTVSPLLRSKKMSGRSIQRRLYESTPTDVTVSWLLDAAQAQFFMGWFEHVLKSGMLPFECPLKIPMGLDNYEARFTDIYSGPELVGVDHWRFTAPLEMFKQPITDAEWILLAPEYILMSSIFDRAMTQEWPRHVDG